MTERDNAVELEPCPFCGWPASALMDNGTKVWRVYCNDDGTCGDDAPGCCAEGPEAMTENEAVRLWNTRNQSTAQPTISLLRAKVERSQREGNGGPDLGVMTHAERDAKLFGQPAAQVSDASVDRLVTIARDALAVFARHYELNACAAMDNQAWLGNLEVPIRDLKKACDALALLTAAPRHGGEGVVEALREARATIQSDRDCLVECATLAPEHDVSTLDPLTKKGADQYDAALAKIDEAFAELRKIK